MTPRERFWWFVNERHNIYLRRFVDKQPWPWTEDEILRTYKFTNVYRELDRTTLAMREHLTDPHQDEPWDRILANCAWFRWFGSIAYAESIGWWQRNLSDTTRRRMEAIAAARLESGQQVFTGAYIITNAGSKEKKEYFVLERVLAPLWEARKSIVDVARRTQSLEMTFRELFKLPNWRGSGFMAYEVVTDLRWTPVLRDAFDKLTWANAGPGARRGLNRIEGKPAKANSGSADVDIDQGRTRHLNYKMQELLAEARAGAFPHPLELREIEHCLCEFDKYERVRNGEGRPRSVYKPPRTDLRVVK